MFIGTSSFPGAMFGWRPFLSQFLSSAGNGAGEQQWANLNPMAIRLSPGNTLLGDTVPKGRFTHRTTSPTDNIRPINFQNPPSWVASIQEDLSNIDINQFNYTTDEVDESVEQFSTTPVTVPTVAYDTDSDNQLGMPSWNPDKGWFDNDLDAINYGPGVIIGHDLDADYQIAQASYYFDPDQSDYREEFIVIAPVPIVGYDTDSENQLSIPYFKFYDDPSNYTFPPIQFNRTPTFVQVNGVPNPGGTASIIVQISPQPGNILIICMDLQANAGLESVVSVVDNVGLSTYMQAAPIPGSGTPTGQRIIYWGFVVGFPTFITVTVSNTNGCSVIVAEYSGVSADGFKDSTIATTTSSQYNPAVQLADPSNILLQFITKANANITGILGTLRFQLPFTGSRLISLLETTDSAHNSTQIGFTFTSQAFAAVRLELRGISSQGAIDPDIDKIPQQSGYSIDPDQSDYGVELVQTGVVFNAINDWSTDSENQIQTPSYVFDGSLSDESVEQIILNPLVTAVSFWDTDSDNQLRWVPPFGRDTVSDEGTELITLPFNDFSTDSENQNAQLPYSFDKHTLDEVVEGIYYAPGVVTGHDHDADIQYPSPVWTVDKDVVDNQVELITLPGLDLTTDSENQITWIPQFSQDDVLDAGVELITYTAGVIEGWDWNTGQELPNPRWYIDVWDQKDIPPGAVPANIVYVMVVYNVRVLDTIRLVLQNTPQINVHNVTSDLSLKVSGVQMFPDILVHNVQATPKIVFGNSTGVFIDNFTTRAGPIGSNYLTGSGPYDLQPRGLYAFNTSSVSVLDGPVQTDSFVELDVVDFDTTLHNNDSITLILRYNGSVHDSLIGTASYYEVSLSANNPNIFMARITPTDSAFIGTPINVFNIPRNFTCRFEVKGVTLTLSINQVIVFQGIDTEISSGRTGFFSTSTISLPLGPAIQIFRSSTVYPPTTGGVQVLNLHRN